MPGAPAGAITFTVSVGGLGMLEAKKLPPYTATPFAVPTITFPAAIVGERKRAGPG